MEIVSEYISKTEMLIRLKCLAPKADDWNNCDEYNVAVSQYDYMCDYLKSIEPADVVPVVHGHWIKQTVSNGRDSWQCSICGRRARGKRENLPYCHCGAIMDEKTGDKE